MVFAIAALALQLHPGTQALAPALATKSPIIIAAVDGTKPTRAPIAPADSDPAVATATTVLTADGTGHIDSSSIKLNDSGEKPASELNTALVVPHDEAQGLALLRIPEPTPIKPVRVYSAETPRMSRSWLALAIAQHSAAAFDAYSTRQSIGHGAVEDDPLMRPFAHSGAIYAAIQVGPLVLDYVARRMQHSEYGMVRRMWFVPQSVSTAGFLVSGVHNLGVASGR
jgi:hypothetical protein